MERGQRDLCGHPPPALRAVTYGRWTLCGASSLDHLTGCKQLAARHVRVSEARRDEQDRVVLGGCLGVSPSGALVSRRGACCVPGQTENTPGRWRCACGLWEENRTEEAVGRGVFEGGEEGIEGVIADCKDAKGRGALSPGIGGAWVMPSVGMWTGTGRRRVEAVRDEG